MSQIASDKPLKFTCCVCGRPAGSPLIALPLPGVPNTVCKSCHQTACSQCYVPSKKMCSKCSDQRGGWCKTPDILNL